MSCSDGESQKLERAQVNAERRAVRQAAGSEDTNAAGALGPERVKGERRPGALHRAPEDGEMTAECFEVRRDGVRAELERLSP